ncbi:MAG: isocitrate/isopropylmalate dehydrogenase family protein [Nitrososphaeria archaeon]|nr:isocitrate/isopropylmalate dehydrogenase family protein [Conexivisphaerales archaeon]
MKNYKISIIRGDGIGPEVISATERIIEAVEEKFSLKFEKILVEAGLEAYKKYGTNLPDFSLEKIKHSDCLLKGPTTSLEGEGTELGVPVKIRKYFDLYANLRPLKNFPRINSIFKGVDLLIVRENTEGMYSGLEYKISEGTNIGIRVATKRGAERIINVAFKLARERKERVTLGHKSNVLKMTDGLYKDVFEKVSKNYPDVEAKEEHIDALAMKLVMRPQDYDVIVLENLYGDIISDLAAGLVGGLGMAPSANIGENFAMFEPIHGSAPDIAGKNIANPIASILSFSMCLDWLGEKNASHVVEDAVINSLKRGDKLTLDLGGSSTTHELAESIANEILSISV